MDASTAILLAKAEMLDDFLGEVGLPVVMPVEVQQECCGRGSLDAQMIAQAIQEKRIAVTGSGQGGVASKVGKDFALGVGEAAAIALAVGRKNAIVATDDKRAINACKLLKVPFTTALSVLVRMREKGVLDEQAAIAKLEALARFGRYQKEIIAAARSQLEG